MIVYPEPTARRKDPLTSHMAAIDARFRANNHRRRALLAFFKYGNLTDFELASKTGLQQTSIGRRRKDCQDAGLVTFHRDEEGLKVKRPAPSGSKSYAWELTEDGRKLVLEILEEL